MRLSFKARRTRARLKRLLGQRALSPESAGLRCAGGYQPMLVVEPVCEAQVASVVRICREGQVRVMVGGTLAGLDNAPPPPGVRPAVALCLHRLNRLLDYSETNGTITVQGGMTLAELATEAERLDRCLPVESPDPHRATVGSVIATNAGGPRSMVHGTIRDYLLDCSVVLADGSTADLGDKNITIAGYELHQLFVGSGGALGVITQATLRLVPAPQSLRMASVVLDAADDTDSLVGQLLTGRNRPAVLALADAQAAGEFDYALEPEQLLLLVGCESASEALHDRFSQFRRVFRDYAVVLDERSSMQEYRELVTWPAQDCDLAFEATFRGHACADLLHICRAHGISAIAHPGNGRLFGCARSRPGWEPGAAVSAMRSMGVSLQFKRLPPGLGAACEMTRRPQAWFETFKNRLDPEGVFPACAGSSPQVQTLLSCSAITGVA